MDAFKDTVLHYIGRIPFAEMKQMVLDLPEMMRLHLAADAAISFSYLIAFFALFVLCRKRGDIRPRKLPFFVGLFLFGGFLLHAMALATPWFPLYQYQGYAKYTVAFFALFSALLLCRSLKAAIALPNPQEVKESERLLIEELTQARKTEHTMKTESDELSRMLRTKTAELAALEERWTSLNQDYAREKARLNAVESELMNRAEKSQSLAEDGRELVLVLSPSSQVLDVSDSIRGLLGYTRDQILGKNFAELIHSEQSPKLREKFAERNTDNGQAFEFKVKHANGSWRYFEAVMKDFCEKTAVGGLVLNAVDVSYRHEIEGELQALPKLVEEIGAHQDFHSGLDLALRKICEFTGWDYGEAWISRGEGKVLECSPSWYGKEDFEEFRKISEELRFPPNMGLPGAVWSLKRTKWIPDVSEESHSFFTRQSMSQKVGIRAAVGIPMIEDDKVLAVLAFFIRQPSREDARYVQFVSTVAFELVSLFRRKRAEEGLREAHDLLEKRIQDKTKELEASNKALLQEIADRRGSEENLRMSQENHLKLVNSLDGIVWEYDLKTTKFTFVSDQAERMLGYPVESWFQEASFWQEHIHGQDREAAASFRSRVAKEREDSQFEYRMITADGRTLWLRDMVTVVMEEGQPSKLCGVMVDITERRQVEEALNQERNFVSAVLDTAGALVMILDVEGKIETFNRACELTSGYPITEVKGKTFWDVFTVPEETEKIQAIYTRLLAGQFPTNFEGSWIAKDGSRRVIAWTTTALFKKDGSVEHVITTGIDITKRKEAEQKLQEAVTNLAYSNEELDKSSHDLQEANDRLKKMDEIKSHFISAASHELRTPLTSVKGYVDVILEGEAGPVNGQQQEFLGYVKESTERLHRLLNELLDISKIESGQVAMRFEESNVRLLLKEEMMVYKAHADEKEIQMVMETDPTLKDIYCDSDKIKEVVGNLLSNAIKYTPNGGEIKILARNHGEENVRIDIKDSGIGIRKADQMRIFEPFQHIEKEGMDHEESTGLGLTLVKKIVEAHQGSVQADSEEGVGSTFSVFLPIGSVDREIKHTNWMVTHE